MLPVENLRHFLCRNMITKQALFFFLQSGNSVCVFLCGCIYWEISMAHLIIIQLNYELLILYYLTLFTIHLLKNAF